MLTSVIVSYKFKFADKFSRFFFLKSLLINKGETFKRQVLFRTTELHELINF